MHIRNMSTLKKNIMLRLTKKPRGFGALLDKMADNDHIKLPVDKMDT